MPPTASSLVSLSTPPDQTQISSHHFFLIPPCQQETVQQVNPSRSPPLSPHVNMWCPSSKGKETHENTQRGHEEGEPFLPAGAGRNSSILTKWSLCREKSHCVGFKPFQWTAHPTSLTFSQQFKLVSFLQFGFKKRKSTGSVDLSKVYEPGRYFVGPDFTFKNFPKSAHFVTIHETVFTKDKVEVDTIIFVSRVHVWALGVCLKKKSVLLQRRNARCWTWEFTPSSAKKRQRQK